MTRLPIHKVLLKSENKQLPITIATLDFSKLPIIIESHKTLYSMTLQEPLIGFEVVDTLYTMNMSNEQYAEELMMVDILDDGNSDVVDPRKVTTQKLN